MNTLHPARTDADAALPRIFFGRVMHARLRPRRNAFVYRVFFFQLPLSALDATAPPFFSINRWNLFSFRFADHGARDGSAPEPWIRDLLAREGLGKADGEVVLQTFPRMLGYVFNPVSFWLCHDRRGALRAVLCEVANTFGERHNYLLAHADERPIVHGDRLAARKVFHVSPFFEVEGAYEFEFRSEAGASHIAIDYTDAQGRALLTSVSGTSAAFSTWNLLRAFVCYPWMTAGVIARIHWQALKLWMKGVQYVPKPSPPRQEITR
jgi:uncharacterized protein